MIRTDRTKYLLAILSGIVVACAYLSTVITGQESFGDVTTNEWLAGIVFVGAGFGITQRAKNSTP